MLIVDDEPVIVDGLAQLFRETDLDLDVYKAYSAVEAMEWIKRTKTDIVISDIRMPGKNGLQLIDELMYFWPSCKVIFLTGHDEFDYVYSAIRKNASHYILKTEDDLVLINAVKQCVDQLDDENQRVIMDQAARDQVALMGPMFRKQWLEALLYGERLSDILVEELVVQGTTKLDQHRPVLLFACRVDRWREDATFGHKLQVYYSIQHVVEERLAHAVLYESLIFEHEWIVWFIQPDPAVARFLSEGEIDWRGLSIYLTGVLESTQNTCGSWVDGGLSFILAKEAVVWDDVQHAFDTIRSFVKRRLLLSQEMAIVDLGAPDGIWTRGSDTPSTSLFEFKRKINHLEKSLEGDSVAQFEQICRETMDDIRQQLSIHHLTGVEKYYLFLLAFLNDMNTIHAEHVSILDIPTDWGTAVDAFIQLGKQIFADRRQRQQQDGDMLIYRVQSYIRENIHSDLSLVRIADAMFFNPSYLSRLYKRHTGSNLSDYIHATRLDIAKRMLENASLKANDIAEKLGFSSPSYFSTYFRKMTGRTPQEFREELSDHRRK